MATIIKASTKRGRNLIDMGSSYEGKYLWKVYKRWSADKEKAWDYCYDKYVDTPESSAFGICSHNAYRFSVSWVGLYEGENAMFIETADNSYVVLLDR